VDRSTRKLRAIKHRARTHAKPGGSAGRATTDLLRTVEHLRDCPRTGKVPFADRRAARNARRSVLAEGGRADVHPYRCGDHWHIGTRAAEPPIARHAATTVLAATTDAPPVRCEACRDELIAYPRTARGRGANLDRTPLDWAWRHAAPTDPARRLPRALPYNPLIPRDLRR
jgi:hypothetical protein